MRRPLGILAVAAVLAACSSDGSAGSTPPPAAVRPELVSSPCPFTASDAEHWECSTLIVPVDRGHPSASHVLLPVAVLRSEAAHPLPDPIVWFSGGPGNDTLTDVAGFFADFAAGGRRDVVLFDQRGTGGARPSLNCPEAEAELRADLASADTVDVEQGRRFDALRACRARLVRQGVDLAAYDTPTTADDAEDLRRALGVRMWNVMGASYGSTVALEVARRHPESVRSVIVDSVFPPDVSQSGTRVVTATARAFDTLFDGCARQPACTASHPDLRAEFNALALDWDAHPFEVEITDPLDGAQRQVKLTGADLASGQRQALYDSAIIPVLPSLGARLRKRDDAARGLVGTLVVDSLNRAAVTAEAIEGIVNCADRERLPDRRGGVDDLVAVTPLLRTFVVTEDECPIWKVPAVPAAFNAVPASKLRLLALAGEYDPTTPPADTQRVARRFSGSTYVLFPGLGHGTVFAHDCPRAIAKAFIDDPSTAPDVSCVGRMGPPAFVAG